MTYIYNERLKEGYYKEVLENGLTVLVYPNENKTSTYAMLSAPVGSTTLDFSVNNEEMSVPLGTAHFLEHKLFENEDGVDAFSLFALTGASANAYTSFDKTTYLFEASLDVEQSLRTLIGFVSSPYFTEATVAKEQGIIGQEIKMYRDHPSWRQLFELFKLLYDTHPIKHEIAGTIESIAEITPSSLYSFYNAFYDPTKMVLAVAGNIKAETVVDICKEMYEGKEYIGDICTAKRYFDDSVVTEKRVEIIMPISSPQFCYGFKEKPYKKEDRAKNELVYDMLLDIICGQTSTLFRKLYDNNLINDILSAEVFSGVDYLSVVFSGESVDPDKVIEEIDKEIEKFRIEGIDDERFIECKRSYLGDIIGDFEDISTVAANLTDCQFNDTGIFDILDIIEGITKEDMEVLLKNSLNRDMFALVVVYPSTLDN